MKRYMLDTNVVTLALKQHPGVMAHLVAVPMAALCVSALTHAEIMHGLARKPDARRLHRAVHEFLLRVEVLPFDRQVSQHYGRFKHALEQAGRSLSTMDMLIAAHADAIGAVLVTHDRTFLGLDRPVVQDWAQQAGRIEGT